MFSVCSTRPVHGAAKYSSRWRAVFHANVATRPSAEIPRSSSTPPSRRVRRAQSPYVIRSRPPAVAVVTPLCPKYCSARPKMWFTVSGTSCIKPFMPGRYVASPHRLPVTAPVAAISPGDVSAGDAMQRADQPMDVSRIAVAASWRRRTPPAVHPDGVLVVEDRRDEVVIDTVQGERHDGDAIDIPWRRRVQLQAADVGEAIGRLGQQRRLVTSGAFATEAFERAGSCGERHGAEDVVSAWPRRQPVAGPTSAAVPTGRTSGARPGQRSRGDEDPCGGASRSGDGRPGPSDQDPVSRSVALCGDVVHRLDDAGHLRRADPTNRAPRPACQATFRRRPSRSSLPSGPVPTSSAVSTAASSTRAMASARLSVNTATSRAGSAPTGPPIVAAASSNASAQTRAPSPCRRARWRSTGASPRQRRRPSGTPAWSPCCPG